MSDKKKVVVRGGGSNLYRITVSGKAHSVEKVTVNPLSTSYKNIGRTDSLDDALSLIRSHSGQDIESISGW